METYQFQTKLAPWSNTDKDLIKYEHVRQTHCKLSPIDWPSWQHNHRSNVANTSLRYFLSPGKEMHDGIIWVTHLGAFGWLTCFWKDYSQPIKMWRLETHDSMDGDESITIQVQSSVRYFTGFERWPGKPHLEMERDDRNWLMEEISNKNKQVWVGVASIGKTEATG